MPWLYMYRGSRHTPVGVELLTGIGNINYSIKKTAISKDWLGEFMLLLHRPTGDQEVVGSTAAEVSNILSWRLIIKYFLWSFSPFRWSKKGSCQFLAKEYAQYW